VVDLSRLSIDNDNLFEKGIGQNGVSDSDIEALSPKLDDLRQKKFMTGWKATRLHF